MQLPTPTELGKNNKQTEEKKKKKNTWGQLSLTDLFSVVWQNLTFGCVKGIEFPNWSTNEQQIKVRWKVYFMSEQTCICINQHYFKVFITMDQNSYKIVELKQMGHTCSFHCLKLQISELVLWSKTSLYEYG